MSGLTMKLRAEEDCCFLLRENNVSHVERVFVCESNKRQKVIRSGARRRRACCVE